MNTGSGKARLTDVMESGVDFLNVVISKDQVLRMDISEPLTLLNQLTTDVRLASYFRERVDIFFDGYNQTREELWEIPEVRNFVRELSNRFPYWLYFLSKNGGGLHVVLRCFLLPFLTPEAEQEINRPKLLEYIEKTGLPAMNHICQMVGLSEDENIEMTDRLFDYLRRS